MRVNTIALCLLLSCLLIAGAGCTTPKANIAAPEGFAEYTKSEPYKAISPEGVVYRVRTEKNEPYAELPFWKEAFKKRMLDAGYVFLSESTIKAGGREGYLLELTAPLGTLDYTYLTAIFVDKQTITIAESAGDVLHVKKRRKAILAAIEHIKF